MPIRIKRHVNKWQGGYIEGTVHGQSQGGGHLAVIVAL